MSRLLKDCLRVSVILLAMQMVGVAQGPPPEQDDRRGPPPGRGDKGDRGPRPGMDFPPFEAFSSSKIVKGVPYSATAITETVQTLDGGAKITHKRVEPIYRDSEGRTRREQMFDRFGPFLVEGEPQQIVFINDVVAGTQIFLDPSKRLARRRPLSDGGPPRHMAPPPPPGDRTSESLGKQVIEGVEAEGTRTTITIPTGRIGNDRPLEIVSERWESPALQVVVLSRVKDPFVGETVYRLVNIKRGEQPRALFEIPADFTLEEGREEKPGPPPPAPPGDRRRPPPRIQ